jgi:hypothetical protein
MHGTKNLRMSAREWVEMGAMAKDEMAADRKNVGNADRRWGFCIGRGALRWVCGAYRFCFLMGAE